MNENALIDQNGDRSLLWDYNWETKRVKVDEYWALTSSSFKLEVAKWNIEWVIQADKFWRNSDIWTATAPEDVWNWWGFYTWFAETAETLEIFSSSVDDSELWTWARTVKVFWLLDENFNLMPPVIVTLNWTTPVSLWTQTYLRWSRAVVLTAWELNWNVWELTIRQTTTIENIFAVMPIWYNQTAIMALTVPLWKTLYVYRWNILMARSWWTPWSANVTIRKRSQWEVFQSIRNIEITNSSWYYFENNWFMVFNEKEDLVVRVESVSDNGTIVTAEFDWILIDN